LATGGGAWLADFEWEIAEKRGELEIGVEIDSEEVGLGLSVAVLRPGGTFVFQKGQVVYLDWE
jgi:hypothetical protein